MGGEHRADPARLDRLVEAEPLRGMLADALKAQETGMPLVGVENLRLGMPGDRAIGTHGPYAPDAEQQLLAEPVFAGAPVQPVGDLAQGRLVLLDVGVEQQQRHPAHLRTPHLGGKLARGAGRAAARERHGDPYGLTVGAVQQAERQPIRVTGWVTLELPALARQRLVEVTVAVEQPHPDDRHTKIARRLEVITGQDAEPARVLRQRGGNAELRREVGDGGRRRGGGVVRAECLIPAPAFQVLVQVVGGVTEPSQEPPVLGQPGQLLRRHLAEQPDRIVTDRFPSLAVDRGEQVKRFRMPGPPQIQHQLAKRSQRLRQRGRDGEPADRSHLLASLICGLICDPGGRKPPPQPGGREPRARPVPLRGVPPAARGTRPAWTSEDIASLTGSDPNLCRG